jgi:hypothetical protein
MTPEVFGRLVRYSIRLRLHAKHDSELLLTAIPELYQPVKGSTIDFLDVISKHQRDVPLLGRLSNTRVGLGNRRQYSGGPVSGQASPATPDT